MSGIIQFDEQTIKPTKRFREAIRELMLAEIEMMQEQGEFPECWRWGVATIVDLSDSKSIQFQYGGEDDEPSDYAIEEGKFQVVAVAT